MSKQNNNRPHNVDSCDFIVSHLLKTIDPSTLQAARIAAAYKCKPIEVYIADALFQVMRETAEDSLCEIVHNDIDCMIRDYSPVAAERKVAS